MNKKIIYIDVDDTISNTRETMVTYYRGHTNDYSTNHLMYDGTDKYNVLCPKWDREQLTKAFYDPVFFEMLEPFNDSQEYIKKLQELNYEIKFCTAHRIEGRELKKQWLNFYFPFVKEIIFVNPFESKEQYKGYGFIDDNINNYINNKSKHKILFDRYKFYNLDNTLGNWKDIYNYFKRLGECDGRE